MPQESRTFRIFVSSTFSDLKEERNVLQESHKLTRWQKKLNKFLIPWDKLPEDEKEKDRVLVKGIPTILAKAGYIMVKIV